MNTHPSPCLKRSASGRLAIIAPLVGMLFGASIVAPESALAAGADFLSSKGRADPPTGARALCRDYTWACDNSFGGTPLTQDQMQRIRAVNARINRTTRSIEDQSQYGVAEVWALPTTRGGDCEDFALLKKRELIRLGVDPQRLLIATVLDRKRNAHAVLVLRSDQGDLVLDNLTDRIRPWSDTRYVFLRMQDPDRPSRWVNVFLGG
jgi:predicted transglutaminase-like cysteine proteinase